MNLDFSKMRKIASDEKTATFQHPRGHVVKIALGALSEEHRRKIGELRMPNDDEEPKKVSREVASRDEKLAQGGEVKPPVPPPPPSDTGTKISKGFNSALGFADGGQAPEDYQPGKDYSEAAKTGSAAPPVVVNVQAPSAQPAATATPGTPGTPGTPPPQEKGFMQKVGDYANQAKEALRPILGGADNGGFGSEQSPVEPQAQAAVMPQQPEPEPPATPAQPGQMEQPDVPQQPQPEPPKPHTPEQVFQNSKLHQADETQKVEAGLNNGNITPKTYQDLFDKKDTLGKIGTIFGLLISGAGSGLTHQPNALLAMMDKQIDNDLNAQQKSQDNKMNLMSMARKQLMDNASIAHLNMETAKGQQDFKIMQKAQADMNATQFAFHKMVTDAAKIPDNDPKKQAAQAVLANLYPVVKDKLSKLEDINAGIMAQHSQIAAGDDPSALVASRVPQHLQQKVYDAIEVAQNTKQNGQKALDDFDKAAAARRSGIIYDSGYNGALHATLGPTFKDVEGTVRQAAMDNLYKNITPSGTDTDARVKVKRQALIDYLKSKSYAPVAKGNGIDLSKFESTRWNPEEQKGEKEKPDSRNNHEAAISWANAHPEDPRSKTILGLVKGR